ncbi:MAG: cyclic nucleotide-binding domain-containing protein [Emcibacteraceae bacterium]
MKQILLPLCRLLLEMQKERSFVVFYLCSSLKDNDRDIRQQFIESNHITDELAAKIQNLSEKGKLNNRTQQKLSSIMPEVKNLTSRRDLVLTKKISVSDNLSNYGHKIIEPIIDLIIEVALNDPQNDSDRVSAFSSFINFSEKMCRGFDHGVMGLSSKKVGKADINEKYEELLTQQKAYRENFVALAREDQKLIFDQYMTVNFEGNFDDISAGNWFEISLKNTDRMGKLSLQLIETLEGKDKSLHRASLTANDKEDTRQSAGLNGFTKKQQEFINTLPLFKGLSEKIKADIFRNASLGIYKKGKLLFLEGDVSDKLYIILEGWVKLYKGNSSGEETIVQMLTSGDMVAESAVFLNAPFPVNAQVAKEARILMLSAVNIRDIINSNNDFAVNVLTAMSVHSQMLMQGLESIRLKSATERVGWFLLKLLLEQGRVPDMVELPYDKSLIASYLDMKPETFSRTLKKFKQKGFEIRKDAVILPQVKALCGFCDSSLSSVCSRHGTPECPNPDCISSKDEIIFYD